MKRVGKIIGLSLAGLLLLSASLVGMSWAPDRSVADLETRWATAPSTFVAVENMQVHLRDEGVRDAAIPVVLLHGTSASLHTWEGWVPALKNDHRVISMDLPGFGLTGPMADGDYSMPRYVQFLTALLDRLGVQKAVLVGNSFGGRLAWEMALAHPERVEKLVLVDAAGYPAPSASLPIGFRIAQIPVLNKLMEVTLPRSMVESSVRDVYGHPEKVTPELVDRYYDLTLRAGNRAALVERFRQAPSGEGADRISTLRLPTLILWGGRDRLIPPDNGEHFHRDISGSQLVVFPELGHVPHEEDAAATVAALRLFIAH